MQLILCENIRGLGSTGDLVKVKDGFARNYLLPKKLAATPTPENQKKFRKEREAYLLRERGRIDAAQLLAEKIKGQHLTIAMKANDAGHLFGSVTEAIVAENLSKVIGYTVEPNLIILGSHYKRIGDYVSTVRLHSEVEVDIDLTITPEAAVEVEAQAATAAAPTPAAPAKA